MQNYKKRGSLLPIFFMVVFGAKDKIKLVLTQSTDRE